MSGLPKEIHIKRKRGADDEVPNFLQLDQEGSQTKRRISSNYIYQRQESGVARFASDVPPFYTDNNAFSFPAVAQAPPKIQTSNPGDERTIVKRATLTPTSISSKQGASAVPNRTRRQFHLSRSSMSMASPGQSLKFGPRGISKKSRYGTAVFVERASKMTPQATLDVHTSGSLVGARTEAPTHLAVDTEMRDAKAQKKPSARRLGGADAKAPVESQRKPPPQVTPLDDADKIAAEMDKWVLDEIAQNLQEMQRQPPPTPRMMQATSPSKPPGSASRFKPRAPAQRFAERNPELARKLDGRDADEIMGGDDDEEDGTDYEIVVYKLAAPNGKEAPFALETIPPEEIGVLKFDSREDMELFYGNDDSDSDSLPDDEEDENAENHYAAEYPEELDSDDSEFDGKALDRDDLSDTGMEHYYRPRFDDEFNGSDEDDDDQDRYIIEGGDESRDRDEIHQEHIRRYIRQFGGN